MVRIFDKDLSTRTFDEFSKLSSEDEHKIRLNPLHRVKKELQKVRAPVIILKPLVETQNILKLLEYFEDSKGIWMYRNYKDLASSNLQHFGIRNGINDLRPIVENRNSDWRSEAISKETREIIRRYFFEEMNPYDAAVLFWYTRNILFFDLDLERNPNVLLCKYEDLVTYPGKVVQTLYERLGLDYPGFKIHNEVHIKSLERGNDIVLSSEIDRLALELLENLNKIYQIKMIEQ